ncbi:MAG: YvcK family protein [Desulfobacterales bacterium]|nr:MAG: YvcK family protein [Desulfobacterales bacterium]
MISKAHKILTFGGGSGQYALLSGLRDLRDINITSVVSMTDNGGSTGKLRDEHGILPPGDVLKCIIALSPFHEAANQILLKRLNGDWRLKGHNAGNMLLTMFSQYTGSFPAAIKTLSEILEVKGRVLPITTDKATLVAELADGTRIYGESAIDIPQSPLRQKIKNLFLVPHYKNSISAYPTVIEEINKSDYILIGPGDLYTSIIAILIVPGIKEEIQKTSAKIFYILNIMTKFGETDNFRGYDFVQEIENYLGRQVDGIICNVRKPNNHLLNKYLNEKSEFVELDKTETWIGDRIIYDSDLLDTSVEIVRHDPYKLASLIKCIVFNKTNKCLRCSKK